MVQWSPDTTPADANGRGGYDYRDSHIKGFSLTHLAGAGCSLYGDFPFLPTTEPLSSSPAARGSSLDGEFQPGFSHAHESGAARLLLGAPQPGRRGRDRSRADGDDPDRDGPLHLPPQPSLQRPGQRRRQRPARRLRRGAGRPGAPRDRRHRLERSLLRAAPPLQGLHRGRLQPPLRRLRHLGRQQASHPARARRAQPERRPRTRRRPPTRAPTRPSIPAATGSSLARVGLSFVSVEDARANLAAEDPGLRLRRGRRSARKATGTRRWGGSGSAAARGACSTPSTRRSTTPSWRRGPSATSAAPTSAWTGSSTAPAAASSTPTSPAGTPTARRSSCSRSWRRGGPARWSARCSPTRRRAAACRAGPTPTARA